jgi:hypothetical protein
MIANNLTGYNGPRTPGEKLLIKPLTARRRPGSGVVAFATRAADPWISGGVPTPAQPVINRFSRSAVDRFEDELAAQELDRLGRQGA